MVAKRRHDDLYMYTLGTQSNPILSVCTNLDAWIDVKLISEIQRRLTVSTVRD